MNTLPTIAAAGYVLYGLAALAVVLMKLNTVLKDTAGIAHASSNSLLHLVPAIIFLAITAGLAVMLFYLSYLLMKRRNRKLSLAFACISCIGIPVGTVLGAFTIFALTRKGVKQEFSS